MINVKTYPSCYFIRLHEIKSREHKKLYEMKRNRETQTSKITNYFSKLELDKLNVNESH